jgi:hypothetical protein
MKKIIIPLLLIVVLLSGFCFYLYKTNTPILHEAIINNATSGNSGVAVLENHFSDSSVQGLEFNYDSSIWDVRKFGINDSVVRKDPGYEGSGILMTNKRTGGNLLFMYTLAFGVGGGWSPFTGTELVKVSDDWARLTASSKDKQIYYYGFYSIPVFFSSSKAGFDEATKFCDQILSNEDVYPILSKEQCLGIRNGSIIGYVPQPQFSRSLKLKRLVPLAQININWENDSYIEQTKIDDGFLIIEIRYYGRC